MMIKVIKFFILLFILIVQVLFANTNDDYDYYTLQTSIHFKSTEIQKKVIEVLENYFIDEKDNLFEDKKPLKIIRDIDNKEEYLPIRIILQINNLIKNDSLADAVTMYLKKYFPPSRHDYNLNYITKDIPVQYVVDGHFENQLKFRESIDTLGTPKSGKPYICVLNIQTDFELDRLIFSADFEIILCKSDSTVHGRNKQKLEIKRDVVLVPKTNSYSDKPKTMISDSLLVKSFYTLINDFMINKSNPIYKDNFLDSIETKFESKLKTFSFKKYQYEIPKSSILYNYFNNYLGQEGVMKSRYSHLYSDREYLNLLNMENDSNAKFNYYMNEGTKKTGIYEVRDSYQDMDEFDHLPSQLKKQIILNQVNTEDLIDSTHHSVSVRNGRMLDMNIVYESYRKSFHPEIKQIFHGNKGITYDIIEFFSRYSTAFITENEINLKEAWYDQAKRIYYIDGREYKNYGEEITARLEGLWRDRLTWVIYSLCGSYKISYYGVNHKTNDFYKLLDIADNIKDEINLRLEIPMVQKWINFDKYSNEITYISIDTVEFYLNLFNVQKVYEMFDDKKKFELHPDDLLGLKLYFEHLFKEDIELRTIKKRWLPKKSVRKILDVQITTDTHDKNFSNNFTKIEKLELQTFFNHNDYDLLHLHYDLFHQVYIKILGSKTERKKTRTTVEKKN